MNSIYLLASYSQGEKFQNFLKTECLAMTAVLKINLYETTQCFIKSGPLCILAITFQMLIDLNENYVVYLLGNLLSEDMVCNCIFL